MWGSVRRSWVWRNLSAKEMVAATLEPSNKGEGDGRWRHVPLKFPRVRLTVNLNSVVNCCKDARTIFGKWPREGDFSDGAGAKFSVPSLPTVVVCYPCSETIEIRITALRTSSFGSYSPGGFTSDTPIMEKVGSDEKLERSAGR